MSKEDEKLRCALWNLPETRNGYATDEAYRDHLLEQYKLYVEMADKISSRRDTANTFFLTLNAAVVAATLPFFEKFRLENRFLLIAPFLVLCLQLFFWWRLINSYKQLNGAKFTIVGALEEKLPSSPYGMAEWKTLLAEGKDRKVYWPLTHLESKIPFIFFIGYLVIFVVLATS